MITTSSSDLRKNLSAMLDRVTADHEPMVITRDKGKAAVVLMSLEDFASYEETRYLLRSPVNADRLLTRSANWTRVREANANSPNEADLQRAGLGGLSLLAATRSIVA